jgi:hypothetical protein
MSGFRLQVSLRDFLVLVTIIAAGIGVAARLHALPDDFPDWVEPRSVPQGAVEGLLTATSLLLFFLAFKLTWPGAWRWLRAATTFAGMVSLWFAAVDHAVHSDWCSHCGQHEYVASVRIYQLPIYAHKFAPHSDRLASVGAILGMPCEHTYHRTIRHRFWGFVYPSPCVNGICCLSDEEVPIEDLRPYLHQMAREDPQLPAVFHRKAFIERDSAYLMKFWTELHGRREADQAVPTGASE